jgi:hypothetical protein
VEAIIYKGKSRTPGRNALNFWLPNQKQNFSAGGYRFTHTGNQGILADRPLKEKSAIANR